MSFKRATLFLLVSWISYLVANSGCSPVKFSRIPPECISAGTCTYGADGRLIYDYTLTSNSIPVDILFVLDNSGSMTPNLQSLQAKFSSFFNIVKSFDYHIAIVTTNVIDANLPNLQNAALVPFANGDRFLTPEVPNAADLFLQAIVRPETQTCDAYLKSRNYCQSSSSCTDYATYCPSQDSRGVYAINQAIRNNEFQNGQPFLRQTAPLEVVLISNSDERVCASMSGCPYQMEPLDDPASIAQTIASTFPNKDVTANVIIIQPGDSGCKAAQTWSTTLFGQYAPIYHNLASVTGGIQGSICAGDYGAQLSQMGSTASDHLMKDFPLNCIPLNDAVKFDVSPATSIQGHYISSTNRVTFDSPLPLTSRIHFAYTCRDI